MTRSASIPARACLACSSNEPTPGRRELSMACASVRRSVESIALWDAVRRGTSGRDVHAQAWVTATRRARRSRRRCARHPTEAVVHSTAWLARRLGQNYSSTHRSDSEPGCVVRLLPPRSPSAPKRGISAGSDRLDVRCVTAAAGGRTWAVRRARTRRGSTPDAAIADGMDEDCQPRLSSIVPTRSSSALREVDLACWSRGSRTARALRGVRLDDASSIA